MGNEKNTHVIFGSSFPRDQEYIEVIDDEMIKASFDRFGSDLLKRYL
jgi:hypothetical protein